jgi:hypothetical protein
MLRDTRRSPRLDKRTPSDTLWPWAERLQPAIAWLRAAGYLVEAGRGGGGSVRHVTAGIFWLKNRDSAHWRDAWQLEHVTGKYLISDKPMTPEQWIKERAVVVDGDDAVDVTPEQPLLSQELSKDNGKTKK